MKLHISADHKIHFLKEKIEVEDDCSYILLSSPSTASSITGIDWVIRTLSFMIDVVLKIQSDVFHQIFVTRINQCFLEWICENKNSYNNFSSTIKRSFAISHLTNEQKVKMYSGLLHSKVFIDFDPNSSSLISSSSTSSSSTNNTPDDVFLYLHRNFATIVRDAFDLIHEIILLNYSKLWDGTLFLDESMLFVSFDVMSEVCTQLVRIMRRMINLMKSENLSNELILAKITSWMCPSFIYVIHEIIKIKDNMEENHLDELFESDLGTFSSTLEDYFELYIEIRKSKES